MDLKYKIGLAILVVAVSFAIGRYTAPSSSVKTVTDTKTTDDKKTDKDTHTTTTTTTTKKPNGEVDTKTVTNTDVVSHTDDNKNTVEHQTQTVTPVKKNTLNVNILAGVEFLHLPTPVYGVSVTDNVLGPISVGVWGLNNGTAGVSLGLSF